jgi:redox-sensitive bicupin YhaK (pirin superfamily)
MTAGRGVVHSELPEQESGRMEGFQLWLNLAASDKMIPPWYRDIQSAELPLFTTPEGVTVRVIAGSSHGVAGAVQRERTEPLYLDIHLPAGARFEQPLPAAHNTFVYVYRGALRIGASDVQLQRMAILANDGERVVLEATQPARALLIAGRPLDEPIAQYGPFVMHARRDHAGGRRLPYGKFAATK